MAELDYSAWRFWLDVVQWIFTLGVMVFVWLDRGRSDNKQQITDLEKRQTAVERDMNTVREQLRHIPTHEDIVGIKSELAGLSSALEGVQHSLSMIQQYLLHGKGN